jgi:ribonuclease PH
MRIDGRQPHELRPTEITTGFMPNAEGSALISMGNTKIICTATVTDDVPFHAKENGTGWITAEYAMLPRSSQERIRRERKGIGGRAQEIQRLIGRSLRAVADLEKLRDFSVIIDCDVLQADGGTRCASITGGFVALAIALNTLRQENKIGKGVLTDHLAAVSLGIVEGRPVTDLCYLEDSTAGTDMNLVMTASGNLVELQATAEGAPFSEEELQEMLRLGRASVEELVALQKQAMGFELE